MRRVDFNGLAVLALESRRAPETAKLIASRGGRAIVAPALREVPLASNVRALEFVDALIAGQFDIAIFLTGVGTRALAGIADAAGKREPFLAALRKVAVVARGPKPLAVLRELNVPVSVAAPEPNTWRELLAALDAAVSQFPVRGRRVAVQEYGVSNPELLAALTERGATVTPVPVYQWALPEDLEPLRAAIAAIGRGEIDIVLFTTSVQIGHIFQVAAQMDAEASLRRGLARMVIASIGPTTSEALQRHGLSADIEPSHPKLGIFVDETAAQSGAILVRKRALP
ncbi:MAG: uroporphyrinogen-III synthase [Candidatus Acidiferrales bacterium]|jgi:uroporphyrinogen-III synthase